MGSQLRGWPTREDKDLVWARKVVAMTQDRVIQESGWVDTGGGVTAVLATTIPVLKGVQFGANCKVCKAQFWVKRPWAKYCSGRCRTRAWRERRAQIRKDFTKIAGKAMADGFEREYLS